MLLNDKVAAVAKDFDAAAIAAAAKAHNAECVAAVNVRLNPDFDRSATEAGVNGAIDAALAYCPPGAAADALVAAAETDALVAAAETDALVAAAETDARLNESYALEAAHIIKVTISRAANAAAA